MSVQFAKSYIKQLFAEKDMTGLYHLISILERDHELPEEFWLFCRVLICERHGLTRIPQERLDDLIALG